MEKNGRLFGCIATYFQGCNGIGNLLTRQTRNFIYNIPYFLGCKTVFFLPKQSKNLNPSYNTDLDLWDCLERVKLALSQNFIRLI